MRTPQSLAVIVSVTHLNCNYTMTASQTIDINGTAFTANLVTYTFPTSFQPFLLTYEYPEVTVTSLQQFETLFIVHPFTSMMLINRAELKLGRLRAIFRILLLKARSSRTTPRLSYSSNRLVVPSQTYVTQSTPKSSSPAHSFRKSHLLPISWLVAVVITSTIIHIL